ncbi:hypothetical protein Pmani_000135 [Petrolisthes manimaculis]|uniref:Vitellogenin n=1 Tax=Petrolisthes manimaculis TaxID=1843537 RepID=A0AAE1QQQ6_9EUCA|nr:hypothetical protein Pmani_000135 [Petrolisthes manimaculis]
MRPPDSSVVVTMTTTTTILILTLIAAGGAAPWEEGVGVGGGGGGGDVPLCSTECSVAASKLSYLPGKTYSYSYSGKSQVELRGVDGAVTQLQWQKQVQMTWLSACDMAVTVTVLGGHGGREASFLHQYPLVAAISDGRVHHVCSHPKDQAWAINIKKGVVSTLQNSLPSLSSFSSKHNLTEIDVVGNCSTQYEVEGEGNRVVVRKEKDHRQCPNRYYTPSETHLPWLRSPLPVQESWSKCTQQINNGIYSSIKCEDHNVVKPMYGSYKFIKANQESTLTYQSVSESEPSSISTLSQGPLIKKTLNYDYQLPQQEESLVPQLEQTLTNICHNTKDILVPNTAHLVAQLIELMRRVPHQTLPQILQKIRSKQMCDDNNKLESLFLDAIAFTQETGAVKIMVDELINGRTSGGRTALYTAAFYLLPRHCLHSISVLQPLFESQQTPTITKLAAASTVNTYCRQNPNCYEEEPVTRIAQSLSNKLQSQCSSSSPPEPVLATLKALANMGVITEQVASSVLTCMETETPNTYVLVAAAETFRLAKCHHQWTSKLVNFVVDPEKKTEVRIAAYLSALRCAKQEHLDNIITGISTHPNTQVRGFILSHLLNVQQSDAPDKQHLRYLLTNYTLPTNFEADLRKYSRNIDLSYWAPTLGVGGGVESNIIYVPGSFLPRSINFNVTAAMDGIPIHLGELGARIQGLEPILAEAFGPEGYFHKTSYEKMLQDALHFIQNNWQKIQQEWNNLRQRRSFDYSLITNFLNSIYGDNPSAWAQADMFVRFLGQEISFASVAGDLKHFDTVRFIEQIIEKLREMIPDLDNIRLNSARAAHINLNYFVPTIQGIPFKLQLNTTAVAALKMQGNLPSLLTGRLHDQNMFNITPSLSTETNGFIGYDSQLTKIGLKTNTTLSSAGGISIKVITTSNNNMELELDLPNNMEIFNMESETYIAKRWSGEPETKMNPTSMRDVRITANSCSTRFQSVLGINMCYELDIPNPLHTSSLPLVSRPVKAKLHLQNMEAGLKGYKMELSMKHDGSKQTLSGKVSTKGSSSPREAQVYAEYKKEQNIHTACVKVESQTVNGKLNGKFINQENHKAIETFVEFSDSTSNSNLAKSIKLDLQKTPTSGGNGMVYDAKVYKSDSKQFPPESVLIEAKYKQESRDPKMDLSVKLSTKHVLREHILIDFDVEGELEYMTRFRLPVPTKLQKVDFQGAVKSWRAVTFFHRTDSSSESTEYSSSFKVSRSGRELVSLEARTDIQGSPGINLVTSGSFSGYVSKITGKAAGTEEYKAEYNMELSRSKYAAATRLLRAGDNMKILDLDTSLQYESSVAAHFVVESQVFSEPIKFEAKTAGLGESQYSVKVAMTKGGGNLFIIQGPVTLVLTPSDTKLMTDVTINGDKRLTTTFIFQEHKQVVSVRFDNQQQPVMVVEWTIKLGSSQGSMVSAKLLLPQIIDGKMDVVMRENILHLSTNTLLLPQTELPRRVKAFTDLNLDSKQWQASVSWDADRDQSKKASIQTQIIRYSTQPPQLIIQNEVTIMGENYRVKLDLQPQSLLTQVQGQGSFLVEMTTPSHQIHSLQTHLALHQSNTYFKTETHIDYKSPENRQYKLISKFDLESAAGLYGFKINSEVDYISPEGQHKSFTFLVNHHSSSQERIVQLKISGQTPSLSQPLITQLQMNCQENSYKIKLETVVSQPSSMFNWQLDIYPQGGIKTMDTAFDMKTIHNVMQQVIKMMTTTNTVNRISYNNPRSVFRSRYHRPNLNTHTVMIQSPSRTMEGQAKYSPSEVNLQFYPNKDQSNIKYVVGVKSHNNYGTTRYEGHVSHPSLSKDMATLLQYSSTANGELQGSFELDIFPDTADKLTATLHSNLIANNTIKIVADLQSRRHKADTADKLTATLHSNLIANNTIKIVADLQSRVLQIKPRIYLELGWAPQTKNIELKFLKNPSSSSSSSLHVIGKWDHISPRDSVMTVRVLTNQSPVMDLSGVIKSQMMPHCNGVKMDARLYTSITGTLDIESDMCRPAFIKLVTNRPRANKIYISKLGVQLPHTAELSISETDMQSFDKYPVFIVGVELTSSLNMKTKLGYNAEKFSTIKDSVLEEMRSVMRATWSWVESVYQNLVQEARQKGITFPDPELSKIMSQISEDYRQICQEVNSDIIHPMWQTLNNFLQTSTITYIKQIFSWAQSAMIQVQEVYNMKIKEVIQSLKETYGGVTGNAWQATKQVLQWVLTGEEPQILMTFLRRCVTESSPALFVRREILEPLESSYPEQYHTAVEVTERTKDVLKQDLEDGRRYMLKFPSTKNIIAATINTLNNEEKLTNMMSYYITSKLLGMRTSTGPESEDGFIMVAIPLYKPMYSVSRAMLDTMKAPFMTVEAAIPFTSLPELYNRWLPAQRLPPPFNATAIIVNGTEMGTFDGGVLRAPRSRCKVVLTSIPGVARVSMSHPQPMSSPEITFQAGHTHASISPDFTVKLNGQTVTNGESTVSPITVMVTSQQVIMESPLVGITLLKEAHVVMVNVSGWAFNYTHGLLGSYDGEVANDWHTRQGRNASSLQELVRSWQEDASCPTPAVHPNPYTSYDKDIKCLFAFQAMWPCHSVVDVRPFLYKCYHSPTVCAALKPYRDVCVARHVRFLPPIYC